MQDAMKRGGNAGSGAVAEDRDEAMDVPLSAAIVVARATSVLERLGSTITLKTLRLETESEMALPPGGLLGWKGQIRQVATEFATAQLANQPL